MSQGLLLNKVGILKRDLGSVPIFQRKRPTSSLALPVPANEDSRHLFFTLRRLKKTVTAMLLPSRQ